jgi:hypothetical protein
MMLRPNCIRFLGKKFLRSLPNWRATFLLQQIQNHWNLVEERVIKRLRGVRVPFSLVEAEGEVKGAGWGNGLAGEGEGRVEGVRGEGEGGESDET